MKRVGRLLLFLVLTLSFAWVSPIHAQETGATTSNAEALWVDTGYAESMDAAASGDINGPAHVSSVNSSNMSDTVRRIVGPVPGLTTTETSFNSVKSQKMLQQSALYNISSYITAMYTSPPASTYAFVQDVGQTLGFIPKQAYAQGVGFSGLSGLLPVWKIFRNISYFIITIIMVVIGFMVMFRKKIDPKTVVTVQNALPRIIITLLLITFSYAIVGFAIDLMYVLIALVGSIFQSTGVLSSLQSSEYLSGNLWGSIFNTVPSYQLLWRILFGMKDVATMQGINVASSIGAIAAGVGLTVAAGPIVGLPALLLLGSPILVGLIVSLALLLLFIRLFVFFLSAYIQIILALIFAPFQLLIEAIPGSKAFDSWFRNLIANILVFPASAVMFMLASVFMNLSKSSGNLWAPPYTSLFVMNTASIGTIVALGLVFAIPSVGKQIKDALKAKPAIQGGMGEIGGMLTAPTQIAMQLGQMAISKKQMEDMNKAVLKATGGGK